MLHLTLLPFSGEAVWAHRVLAAVALVLAVRWWPAKSGAPRAERTLVVAVLLGRNQGGTLAESVGFGRSLLDYPRVLNRFAIGDWFLPIGVMILATALAWYVGRGTDGRFASWTAHFPAGWMIWSAWVVRPPISHVRYLFPAVG